MYEHTFSDRKFGSVDLSSDAALTKAICGLLEWNREDLLDELTGAWKGAKEKSLIKAAAFPSICFKSSVNPPIIGGGDAHKLPLSNFKIPVPNQIAVHKPSAVLYNRAQAGHCLTGVVRLGKDVLQLMQNDARMKFAATNVEKEYVTKIFLFPLDPTDDYKGRKWDDAPEMLIYEKKYPPIIHGARGVNPSHATLVEHIREKKPWKPITQEYGFYIGFTVCKGGRVTSNRYAFTSMSSNSSFQQFESHSNPAAQTVTLMGQGGKASGGISPEWREKIKFFVEKIPAVVPEKKNRLIL